MKFFLDTADLSEIEEAASWGAIAGVTTNPSLYAKIGGKLSDFDDHIARICDIVGPDCPVSAESVAMDREGILADARKLAAIAPNVVVKVPTMVEGLAATRMLADEGIRVNMTLCFSVPQAILAARAGARYISPFIGRFDDISEDGLDQVGDIVSAGAEASSTLLRARARRRGFSSLAVSFSAIYAPCTFSQSFMKESSPRSVSGCRTIFLSTPNGTVAMSAPMSAHCVTWLALRTLAAMISTCSPPTVLSAKS